MKLLLIIGLPITLLACKFNSEDTSQTTTSTTPISNIQNPSLKESMERGGLVYTDFCMQCHLANGYGVPGSFPPLAQSDWLTEKRTESIHAVKYGQQGEITVNGKKYNSYMAPMGLTDEEVADVMNYIMNSWGNTQTKMVTPAEVKAVEK
ncbi:cytochrome c [Aureisphaera galaxeae]|uniref:c-type cytochrome n=1 Tax=Aureisphaera galaxeae TaxID=1538023 RepID=UPI0023504282|nr:cytochrome c [Aureisphaera galaxeae]MDC8003504.1 cytochrome c [Aureisphaera galaxeae]